MKSNEGAVGMSVMYTGITRSLDRGCRDFVCVCLDVENTDPPELCRGRTYSEHWFHGCLSDFGNHLRRLTLPYAYSVFALRKFAISTKKIHHCLKVRLGRITWETVYLQVQLSQQNLESPGP